MFKTTPLPQWAFAFTGWLQRIRNTQFIRRTFVSLDGYVSNFHGRRDCRITLLLETIFCWEKYTYCENQRMCLWHITFLSLTKTAKIRQKPEKCNQSTLENRNSVIISKICILSQMREKIGKDYVILMIHPSDLQCATIFLTLVVLTFTFVTYNFKIFKFSSDNHKCDMVLVRFLFT